MTRKEIVTDALEREGYRFLFGKEMLWVILPSGKTKAIRMTEEEARASRKEEKENAKQENE